MKPAVTLEDAAYKSLANYNRNIWEQGGPWWSFDDAYIDRSSAPEGALPTTFRLIERRLLEEDGPTTIMFTGQTGCGKSMELRRLSEEPKIRERFELIRFSVLDKLNDAVDNDLNHVLLATASELADHVVDAGLHTVGRWDKADKADGELRRWLSVLARGDQPKPPARFDELAVRLKSVLADWSIRLRSEAELRREVSGLEARDLQALTSMLLTWVADVTERKTLLVVDDADKLYAETSVDAIFRRGLRTLTDLPTKMVLTFPLNLAYDSKFRPPANVHVERLFNVKVIRRDEPSRVLAGAVAFFRKLLASLVDPAAELIDAAVVDQAVRLSAGVPREFVRLLLKLACEEADLAGRARVTVPDFKTSVANYLRRELVPRTQLDPTPASLMRVRLTKKVSTANDLALLHANLIVDYVNETSWQDVNPVLIEHVNGLLDEQRALLAAEGLNGPAVDRTLREYLAPAPQHEPG
ncbi:MAG: hypothetical protein AAGF11_46525 [Myxococcota bacterium]